MHSPSSPKIGRPRSLFPSTEASILGISFPFLSKVRALGRKFPKAKMGIMDFLPIHSLLLGYLFFWFEEFRCISLTLVWIVFPSKKTAGWRVGGNLSSEFVQGVHEGELKYDCWKTVAHLIHHFSETSSWKIGWLLHLGEFPNSWKRGLI